jgi:proline iminopeptidase
MAPTQEHLVETEHGRVYVEVEGDAGAEVVVLAAGGPGVGHDHYHPWFSRLTPASRVAYLDYSGCGRSEPLADDTGYSVELFAGNIEAVRQQLDAESFALVGLSFGGFPAVEYALTHPGRVRRLVLSSAQVTAAGWQRWNIDAVNAELQRLFPAEWQEILRLREEGVRSLDPRYQELVARVVPALEWVDPWNHPRLNRPDHGHSFEPAVYRAVVGDDPEWQVTGTLAGYDRLDEFARLPPTLVLSGRYDRLTPPAVAFETFAALAPERRSLHVLERSAHRPWAEEPDEYFATVRAFLAA